MKRSMESAARRQIAELEARVTRQGALVEGLVASNRDANAATRTLRMLEQALALTEQHLNFMLQRGAPSAEPQTAG